MSRVTIKGYSDVPSVAPGETITFFVSSESPGTYEATLVRLINGDLNPDGPGVRETRLDSSINGEYPARKQRTQSGGYIEVDDMEALLSPGGVITVHAFLSAMLPRAGAQAVLSQWDDDSQTGWLLQINEEGCLEFRIGDGRGPTASVASDRPLFADTFYSVAASFDPETRELCLHQRTVVNSTNGVFGKVVPIDSDTSASTRAGCGLVSAGVPLIIAGAAETAAAPGERTWVTRLFNGKIDRPKVLSTPLDEASFRALSVGDIPANAEVTARWDFAYGTGMSGIPTDHVEDLGPHGLHGRCVNQPDRAMTGWNWQGIEEHFKYAPEQYGAIWFHSDSLDDCRWDSDFSFTVPDDLGSACYAIKLVHGDAVDYIPFFVRPPRGRATAKVALLIPTYSYLAYANSQVMQNAPTAQAIMGHITVLEEIDLELNEQPGEYGLSTYDYHADGRGCQYSSWRRPILNMRPRYRHEFGTVWQYPADLHLVDWLYSRGFDVDIITDHDVHDEGEELLSRYNVVVTGTHPEYYSRQMIDAWENYLAGGGRGMYLAGNGMYWIASPHPEKPWLIEVRKGEVGDQAWRARPGELYHSTSGERGGLWRMRARSTAKVWGVVYTSHGLDISTGFHQMPDARNPDLDWMFEGIGPDEVIGDFGLIGGGAAGLEVDRYDQALGTPPNTHLVASSYGHSPNWALVPEEQYFAHSGMNGPEHPLVHGDITYFSSRNGGAMFASSSMTWCASLSHNDYENNVSQLTANVLRRFAQDGPLQEI